MKRLVSVLAFFCAIYVADFAFAQNELSGGFGLELGSELKPSADGSISLRGYPTTNFSGRDQSGIFSEFAAAVTPSTERIASIVGFSDGSRSEEWCESTAAQLARTLSTKYGQPLENVISIEAFRRGDLYIWRQGGRSIELACRSFGLMQPFYVQIYYTDEGLMEQFVSENLEAENGALNIDDF